MTTTDCLPRRGPTPGLGRGTARCRGRPTGGAASGRRRTLVAWAFCSPFMVLFATFGIWPVFSSLSMSVTDITSRDSHEPIQCGLRRR